VLIQRDVRTDVARAGSVVGVNDVILTTDTGSTQWQMSDDSIFAMAPGSGFKINKYALPSSGAAGVASYTLLQGSVHTITGKIGKSVAANSVHGTYVAAASHFNPSNLVKVVAAPTGPYTLKSALATLTSTGADFLAVQSDKLFQTLVNAGSVSVCTVAGCETATTGDGIFVNCPGCKPVVVPGSTLGLSSVVSSLDFNRKLAGDVQPEQGNDLADKTTACRTVLGRIQGGGCRNVDGPNTGSGTGSGAGQSVSPN
jgi:hypothetical protein